MAPKHWVHWADLWKHDAERGFPPHRPATTEAEQLQHLHEGHTLVATRAPFAVFTSVACSALSVWRIYHAMDDSVMPHSVFRQYVQTCATAILTATFKHGGEAARFNSCADVLDEVKADPRQVEHVVPLIRSALDAETLSIGYFIAHAEGRTFVKQFAATFKKFDAVPLGKAAVALYNHMTEHSDVSERIFAFFHARKNFSGVQKLSEKKVELRNATAQQLLSSLYVLAVCTEELRDNGCVNRLPPSPTIEFGVVPDELKPFPGSVEGLTTMDCVDARKTYSIPVTGPWREDHLDVGPLEPLVDPTRATSLVKYLRGKGADEAIVEYVQRKTKDAHSAMCMVTFSVLPPTMVLEDGHLNAFALLFWPFISHKVAKWSPFLRFVPGAVSPASSSDWAHFVAFVLLMHHKYSNFCPVPDPQLYITYGLNTRTWLPVDRAEEILLHLSMGKHVGELADALVSCRLLSRNQKQTLLNMLRVDTGGSRKRLTSSQRAELRQAAQQMFFAHVARTGSHGDEPLMKTALQPLKTDGSRPKSADIKALFKAAHEPLFGRVEPAVFVRSWHGPSTDEVDGEAHPTAPDAPIDHLRGAATNSKLKHTANTVLRDRVTHGDEDSAAVAAKCLGARAYHKSLNGDRGTLLAAPGCVFHGPVEFQNVAAVSAVVLGVMAKAEMTDALEEIATLVPQLYTDV